MDSAAEKNINVTLTLPQTCTLENAEQKVPNVLMVLVARRKYYYIKWMFKKEKKRQLKKKISPWTRTGAGAAKKVPKLRFLSTNPLRYGDTC